MPDIDMDFDERYRGDMIRYAAERYGADHVAQIVTFSTIKARAAVRDAARVLGYPPQLGDKIAKAMPSLVMGQDLPLARASRRCRATRVATARPSSCARSTAATAEVQHVVDVAKGFVDKRRQDGIHAAAVVITKEPVLEYVPVQRKAGPNGSLRQRAHRHAVRSEGHREARSVEDGLPRPAQPRDHRAGPGAHRTSPRRQGRHRSRPARRSQGLSRCCASATRSASSS